MLLLAIALLTAPAAGATGPQCRTMDQMLSEAHGYLARVQPMMDSRRQLSERLVRLRMANPLGTGLGALFDARKDPARLREAIGALGERIEAERQASAARIAALQSAC